MPRLRPASINKLNAESEKELFVECIDANLEAVHANLGLLGRTVALAEDQMDGLILNRLASYLVEKAEEFGQTRTEFLDMIGELVEDYFEEDEEEEAVHPKGHKGGLPVGSADTNDGLIED